MRKLSVLAVGVLALSVSGLAVGMGLHGGSKTARLVAGTFNATTASQTFTRTCTTQDGKTIVVSHGKYTGLATGDPDLTGPITVFANSAVNTTDGVGVVRGRLKIDVAGSRHTVAHYDAVYDHGNIAGLARGHAHDPYVDLLSNLSAGFSTAGGFTSGKLGGATGPGSAVELGPTRCVPNRPPTEKSAARGTVSAVSSMSITVAGLTCAVPPPLAAKVATFKVGDRAEIHCQLTNGTNMLVRIDALHHR
jgi:hypothetical protein